MDIFAHTLWTNALFHLKYHNQRKWRYLAAFFGVAPDFVGFTPLFVYLIFSGRIFSGFPFTVNQNWTFAFAENAYNYTHSLVIFAACFILVTIIGNVYFYHQHKQGFSKVSSIDVDSKHIVKKPQFWFFWPMLGWALHILIDIPTHPDFYSTPFLFPLSHFKNHHGVSWGHPIFMAVNYSLLTLMYIGLFYYQRRKLNALNVK